LADQFIMDMHTHFLRDDTRLENFVRARERLARPAGTQALGGGIPNLGGPQVRQLRQGNLLDSDTKVACISGAPSDLPEDWF